MSAKFQLFSSRIIQIFFVVAIVLAASQAHAAVTPEERLTYITYSEYKTFRQFTAALQRSQIATKEQVANIEQTLNANGLTLDTEILPGVYTDTKISWGDVRLSRLNNGDWKNQQGRILSSKPDATIDQLFAQAMTALSPRNSQRTPMDFLIDTAEAQGSPQARASAAGGWGTGEWLRRRSSSFRAGWNNSSKGHVECSGGSYVINMGYKASGTDWSSEKIPDHKVGSAILKTICGNQPVPSCTERDAVAVMAILRGVCELGVWENAFGTRTLATCTTSFDDAAIIARNKSSPNWIAEVKRKSSEAGYCTAPMKGLGVDNYDSAIRRGQAAH